MAPFLPTTKTDATQRDCLISKLVTRAEVMTEPNHSVFVAQSCNYPSEMVSAKKSILNKLQSNSFLLRGPPKRHLHYCFPAKCSGVLQGTTA